jgi:hypothetical protein
MITAYDYPTAKHAENAGFDVILVGDSLGMVYIEKLISDIPSILNKCKKIDDHCITEEIISYNIPIIDCPYYEFVINNFESIDNKIKENDTDNMYCFRNKNYKGNTDTEGTNKDIAIINKLYDYFYRL